MLQRLIEIPASVPIHNRRYFSLANAIGLGGFAGHVMLLLSFVFFDIWPMVWFNIGSLAIFAVIFAINRKGHGIAGIYLGSFEVMLHALVAVILLGWESGFYFYLSLIFMFAFFSKKEHDRAGLVISAVNLVIFAVLLIYTEWGHQILLVVDKPIIHFYSITNMLISSTLMALGIYYYKHTANRVEEELERAHKRTQDSIRYAQRIQKVLLPTDEYLAPYVKEHFVFFKSRDIVSGDFYWMRYFPEEDRLMLAAIDCTGHGVPGAFMTMMAAVLLESVVTEQGIRKPNEILEHLHKRVFGLLKQGHSDRQEGMDMAVCAIDFRNKEMAYAGAKMPLLYIENGTLNEIKPSKRSVGGLRTREGAAFELHTLPITPALTSIYLFTDGFTDQFGGENKQKFSNKRFKLLIEEIQNLPMSKQKEAIQGTFDEWMKGGTRQIDDVMVMGLRIS